MMFNRRCQAALLAVPLFIGGCGNLPTGGSGFFSRQDSAPAGHVDISKIPDAIPRAEPHSRYGNPDSYVVFGKRYHVKRSSVGHVERGIASWYGTKFHGRRTSSGEPYNMYAMTAAHKSLPLPTYAEVTNLENGRKITVKINDRGPFKDNRIIDLSYVAAKKLGIAGAGTGLVEVRAINPATPRRTPAAPTTTAAAVGAAPSNQDDKLRRVGATQDVGIYLQVGAFGDRYNAENLRARIRDIDTVPLAKINVTQGVKADISIFRVRIGPIDNVPEADQVIKRLAALGIKDPHIIID